ARLRGMPARIDRHAKGERPVHRRDPRRPRGVSMPPRRAVLFDLDNTLILEDASTHAAVREAARAAAERAGVDADQLATSAMETAGRLWKAAPAYAYGEAFGIWWGEALWGGFAGESTDLDAIRAFLPGFRDAVWRE